MQELIINETALKIRLNLKVISKDSPQKWSDWSYISFVYWNHLWMMGFLSLTFFSLIWQPEFDSLNLTKAAMIFLLTQETKSNRFLFILLQLFQQLTCSIWSNFEFYSLVFHSCVCLLLQILKFVCLFVII